MPYLSYLFRKPVYYWIPCQNNIEAFNQKKAIRYFSYEISAGGADLVELIGENDTMDSFMTASFAQNGKRATLDKYLAGAALGDDPADTYAYFTNQLLHITAISLNLVNNAVLKVLHNITIIS